MTSPGSIPAASPRPFGQRLPRIRTPPPGPTSGALARRLRMVESRNVTFLGLRFPVFWEEARGANVLDADGNLYLDWTGAFGVSLAGHRHPAIVAALEEQAGRLVHGMGDVHPPSIKLDLLERLVGLAPWKEARAVLGTGGSEAVEIALKTAHLATGRSGVVAFRGAYHGLTAGALATTARPYFREPFRERLHPGVAFLPFPTEGSGGAVEGSGGAAGASGNTGDEGDDARTAAPDAVLERLARLLEEGTPSGHPVGAVIVEPVQGRAGVREFPGGFLARAAELARSRGAVVIADEVFTGLGRTGEVWASVARGLEADLLCVGKALGGGLPLSACLGRREVMDAWPESPGEALHTSTFLGHPLACATGLAFLDLVVEQGLPAQAKELGARILGDLRQGLSDVPGVTEVRGSGLLLGIELSIDGGSGSGGAGGGGTEAAEAAGTGESSVSPGTRVAEAALGRGLLLLPAGEAGEVVEAAPPAIQTAEQVAAGVRLTVEAVRETLGEAAP